MLGLDVRYLAAVEIHTGLPDGFDWNAYDKTKIARQRAIEQRRRMLGSFVPALQRIASGGATPFPPDQALVMECVRLALEEVCEDMRGVFELTHRHPMPPTPPESPKSEPPTAPPMHGPSGPCGPSPSAG